MAGSLRITGGALSRRRIEVPPAADRGLVRPTSDKVREALFSSLGGLLDGARVLDAFAGSGALGFEALSRGASHVTFLEKDTRTADTLRDNARALGVEQRCQIVVEDAKRGLARLGVFDLVLCDPPYAFDLDGPWPARLAGATAEHGTLVVERGPRGGDPVEALRVEGLSLVRERLYGDTRVFVFRRGEAVGEGHMGSVAIYPGSFDPLTNGHVDIIERGLRTFDKVIVAVANNVQKQHVFSIEERTALTRQSLAHLANVEIDTFDGLVVDYAKAKGVRTLLRGLRAVSDFEYELQLASMNRRLQGEVETVFMMTSEELFYVSSKLVREVASFGGDITSFVPPSIAQALVRKIAHGKKAGGL